MAAGDRARRRRLADALCLMPSAMPSGSGLSGRAAFQLGDWAKGLDEPLRPGPVQPALCRRPMPRPGPGVAEYEPAEALFAGADGLDDYRRLAPEIGRLLAPGGLAAIEIGHDQATAPRRCSPPRGMTPTLARDLAGRPRALLIRANRRRSSKMLGISPFALYIGRRDGAASHDNRRAPRHRPPTKSPRSCPHGQRTAREGRLAQACAGRSPRRDHALPQKERF